MRKFLLTGLLVSCGLMYSKAQTQLNNGGFENWNDVGSNTERPVEWSGTKSGQGTWVGAAPKSLERSTDTRGNAGNQYSARVYSSSTLGVIANGNLTTGRVNAGSTTPASSSNYNITLTGNAPFSETLNAWPDSLVFWAKYNNSNVNSKARVRAVIHDNYNYRDPSDAAAVPHAVGNATLNFPRTNGAWVRFSVPFDYTGPATSPDYILVTFTSNETPGGGSASDVVWVDDVTLIYNPVTTTASTISPLAYNVSSSVGASITVPFTTTGIFVPGNVFTAQLSDASGSFASPITLGTLTSRTAGTITGTIPAGTPSGSGYRVRVVSSTPYQTATPNVSNITINLVSNAIAPTAAQTIAAGTNGTALTVTEAVAADSRVWKFSTTSGGPYNNFTPSQTGTTYTPNFTNAGTYYVICESTFGALTATSNQVTINVVKNQIAPAGTQSLLVGVSGTTLTVTETPAGTAREWKFSTTAGGPYNAFSPVQTGTTYTPLFAAAGTYYVVCESNIGSLNVISNEVVISVGSINLSTGTITGSPFEFSASAPAAVVTVPYTASNPFNAGNVFTAQLSDANGSFASPTVIGTANSNVTGSITASIPANTPEGTGYLIRVVSSSPSVLGSDNGTALTVDQYHNSLAPSAPQTFVYTAGGSQLTVTESQATTSREWRIATVAGGPYTAVTPAQTGTTYTPTVSAPGTYYVVCASTNGFGDEVLSNEVVLNAENANTLTTSAVAGSPFYVSENANNTLNVNFTTDITFNAGNVFTAQLSNAAGSFAVPVTIGTLTSATPAAIPSAIPNAIQDGSGYRIRVISSSPAVNGTDNGTNLSIVNFALSVTPADTQTVAVNVLTAPVTAQSTHPGTSVEWLYRFSLISPYAPFPTPVTGNAFSRAFSPSNTYYVVARGVNQWNDTLVTEPVVYNIYETFGIDENASENLKAYMNHSDFIVDLTHTSFQNPQVRLVNMAGQVVYTRQLQGKAVHTLPLTLATGVYTYQISENGKETIGKVWIQP